MSLEKSENTGGPSVGAKLLLELCDICRPNGGNFIWKFGKKHTSEDKNVTMIFGLHGDEIAPVQALKMLMPQIVEVQSQFRGQVTLIVGNPFAVALGIRGVQDDANRLFGKNGSTFDHQRVMELEAEIKEDPPDALEDYHCTRNPSKPFVFVPKGFGNHDEELTQKLVAAHGLESVVLADYSTYTDSANEVDHWSVQVSEGAIKAITVEAGWMNADNIEDPNGPVAITVAGVKNSLSALGIFDFGNDADESLPWEERDKWDIFGGVYAGLGFQWNGAVANFGKFSKGEIYAYQNGKPLFAEEDFTTMFVKNNGDFDPNNSAQRVALLMRRLQ